MKRGLASGRSLALVMQVGSGAFFLLAAVTWIYGTDFGLDGETVNILAAVFIFLAVADAFASMLLKRRGGGAPVWIGREAVTVSRQRHMQGSDRQDLDRAEDEGMIGRSSWHH